MFRKAVLRTGSRLGKDKRRRVSESIYKGVGESGTRLVREDVVAKRAFPIGGVALPGTSRLGSRHKDGIMYASEHIFRGRDIIAGRCIFYGGDKGVYGDVLERATGNIHMERKRRGESLVRKPTSEQKAVLQRRDKLLEPGGFGDGLRVDDLAVDGEGDDSGGERSKRKNRRKKTK